MRNAPKLGSFIDSLRDSRFDVWSPRIGSMVRAWHQGYTMKEIGQVHGVELARIQQLLRRASRLPRPINVTSEDAPERVAREWERIMSRTNG